jgi:hypothetical protein
VDVLTLFTWNILRTRKEVIFTKPKSSPGPEELKSVTGS